MSLDDGGSDPAGRPVLHENHAIAGGTRVVPYSRERP
jgi:hypothetical protein